MKQQTETWMWRSDGSLWGLTLDLQNQQLQWMDGSGCHCDDQSDLKQTLNDYRHNGAPAFISLPADVRTELETLVPTTAAAKELEP